MKTIAWTMTAETAMEFFKRCAERGAISESDRVKILAELAQEGRMNSVVGSDKTQEEYIMDKAKQFKILKIEKREE